VREIKKDNEKICQQKEKERRMTERGREGEGESDELKKTKRGLKKHTETDRQIIIDKHLDGHLSIHPIIHVGR
jgi:hypothetical protein